MLTRLFIENYAIIDEINIEFDKGMVVMTGETGAGKSIMLGAMGLLLGDRVQSSVLNSERGSTVVEGDFVLEVNVGSALLEKYDILDGEVCIRRMINSSGRSRSFVNDIPCSLQELKEMSSFLIDIHRQFDNSWLFADENQIHILDILADQTELAQGYHQEYLRYRDLALQIKALEEDIARQLNEQDFLRFQLQEFEEISLDELDVEALESERDQYDNVDRIKEVLSGQQRQLQDAEDNILDRLRSLYQEMEDAPLPAKSKEAWSAAFHTAIEELDAMANDMMDQGENLYADPERHQEISALLETYYRLQKKHQAIDLEALKGIRDGIQSKLDTWDGNEIKLNELRAEREKLEKTLRHKADTLTEARKGSAALFGESIEESLSSLSMPNARFKVSAAIGELNAWGKDEVQFLFSANPGQDLKDFRQIASGGERSRLALCIKKVIAGKLDMPTVVFDEIDSGVSGDTALKMAQMLRKLSEEHQIIVITHSPQVASTGNQHLYISKEVIDDRSYTRIRELSTDERVVEIAVMLSSNPPSEAALVNAADLLGV